MSRRSRSLAVLVLGWLLVAGVSKADLGDDVERLTLEWKKQGQIQRVKPRLAERPAPVVIFLPAELLTQPAPSCASVVVIGPSSTHFTVRAVGGPNLPESSEDWPQASLAGLVQLTRCGRGRLRLAALLVEMRSPRAVLETLVVVSKEPVRPAVDVLPQRDPGPIAPLTSSGPRAEPAAIGERIAVAEARAHRDRARAVTRSAAQSSSRGGGALKQAVEAGCHRFDLIVEPPTDEDTSFDFAVAPALDSAASLVSIERGDGLDAAVSLCAAEHSEVEIEFAGAPSNVRVWSVLSSFTLPAALPESWGALGRARIAAVLRRHGTRVSGSPFDQALGIQGPTLMPVEVEPGACYVAVLAAVRGEPLALALAAQGREVSAQNHGGPHGDSTLVSFCARSQDRILFEADSRGTGLVWLFAVFQSGRFGIGEDQVQ